MFPDVFRVAFGDDQGDVRVSSPGVGIIDDESAVFGEYGGVFLADVSARGKERNVDFLIDDRPRWCSLFYRI